MLLRLATRSESCDRARIELNKLALALVPTVSQRLRLRPVVPQVETAVIAIQSGQPRAEQIRPRARRFRNPTHVIIITWIVLCATQYHRLSLAMQDKGDDT